MSKRKQTIIQQLVLRKIHILPGLKVKKSYKIVYIIENQLSVTQNTSLFSLLQLTSNVQSNVDKFTKHHFTCTI